MLEKFKRIARLLFEEGLVSAGAGSMSLKEGEKIYITKKGALLADLTEEDIIEAKDSEPSDLEAHQAIYKQTKAQAIIHAHPPKTIAISITDNKIVPQDSQGLSTFRTAPIVRLRNSSDSKEIAKVLPSFFSNNVIVAIKGHGTYAVGTDFETAYKATSTVENSCQVIIAVRSAGSHQAQREKRNNHPLHQRSKSAIPPGIGVMDRSRYKQR